MSENFNRREFIRTASIAAAGVVALSAKPLNAASLAEDPIATFRLPELPYAFNALEPHIDAMTMEIHHGRHHKAYVDNLNKACAENKITETSLEKLLSGISTLPMAIRNNGGGHYNHSLFWQLMKPNGGGVPMGPVADAIDVTFGNFELFKTKFSDAAKGRFGSGWAWLIKGVDGKLKIVSTPNQDNPLMDIAEVKGTPLLCLDVWEHAYYLKYQNKRADYINAFWNVVNWEEVAKRMG